MSFNQIIFVLSILIMSISCVKEKKNTDSEQQIKDAYIGSYIFEYTYSSNEFSSLGVEVGHDTTYTSTRTISIQESTNCDAANELSILNILGEAKEDCFIYSANTYILKNNYHHEGEGILEGKNLSIDFKNIGPSTQFVQYRIYGTAFKN